MFLYFTHGYFFVYNIDQQLSYSEVYDIIKNQKYTALEYNKPHNRDRMLIRYDYGKLNVHVHRFDQYDNYIAIDITNSLGEFIHLIYSGRYVVPYQSSYMRKSAKLMFADKDLFMKFIISKQKASRYSRVYEVSKYSTNNPIDSDFHKLGINYEYIYDIDPNTIRYTESLYNVFDWITLNNFELRKKFLFVPYITTNITSQSISRHNYFDRVFIADNSQFIKSYGESRGEIIYLLNNYFDSLQNMEKLIGYDDISNIIAIEYKKAYGLDEADIMKKIKARNDAIKLSYIYKNIPAINKLPTVDDCNEIRQQYIDKLKMYDIIQYKQDDDKDRIQCESLLLKEPLWDNIDSINSCKHKYMSYDDTPDGSSFVSYCYDLLRIYDNYEIKDKLFKMIPKPIENKVRISRTIKQDDPDVQKFRIFDFYMPEWRHHMLNDDFDKAFDSRQMIISSSNLTYFLRQCSKIFRSDPFVSKSYNIPGIIHDVTWNKVVIACIAQSDLLFPIRIVDAGSIENLSMYRRFEIDDKYEYIGAMVTDMCNGKDYINNTYYISYVYKYNNKLRMTNFRGNVLTNGTILEYIRALYLELTVLKYYSKDIGTHLYFYKYIYDDGKMFDVYVSKYNKIQITKQYKEQYGDIISYVDKLIPVTLEKEGRKFKFVTIQ